MHSILGCDTYIAWFSLTENYSEKHNVFQRLVPLAEAL